MNNTIKDWIYYISPGAYFIKLFTVDSRDDNPGESRPRDPGESHILGPGFSPGFIDGIPGLQE